MKIISHRGNIDGRSDYENHPNQILQAISLGYDCEVDVWAIHNNIYLGHDEPQYRTNLDFIKHRKIWCHAKNLEALQMLIENKCKCFWHENDCYTIVSNKKIWAFPGMTTNKNTIIVDLSADCRSKDYKCYGVCTDWV